MTSPNSERRLQEWSVRRHGSSSKSVKSSSPHNRRLIVAGMGTAHLDKREVLKVAALRSLLIEARKVGIRRAHLKEKQL